MLLSAASVLLASAAAAPVESSDPTLDAPFSLEPSPLAAAFTPEPLVASMGKLGWTFIEIDYVYTDLNDLPGSQNGYQGIGSWNPLLGFIVQGSYAKGDGTAETERYRIGGGYHVGIGDRLDAYGLISYEHDWAKVNGASGSDDGYEVDIGARFMLFEDFEVNGQLEWNHVDGDDFGVQVGARWYLAGPVSIGATIESIDQDFRFTAGARVTL